MSPFALFLEQSWGLWTLAGTIVVKWWAIWFILGRNFSTTTTLTTLAVGGSAAMSTLLLKTGALGPFGGEGDPSWLAWGGAGFFTWILFSGVEVGLLTLAMKRHRRGWSWQKYDLVFYLSACAFVVIAVGTKMAFKA